MESGINHAKRAFLGIPNYTKIVTVNSRGESYIDASWRGAKLEPLESNDSLGGVMLSVAIHGSPVLIPFDSA